MTASDAAPLRVVLFIRSLDVGGTERQVVTLARGLRERGHDVTVAVLHRGGRLEQEVRDAGIGLIELGRGARRAIAGVVLHHSLGSQWDVVYSFLPGQNLLALLAGLPGRRPPVVWGVRRTDLDLRGYNVAGRLSFALEPALSRFADAIVFNANAGRTYAVRHGFRNRRLRVIENGIDVARFRPDPQAGREFRRRWGLAPDRPVIGLVSRIDVGKGHETFLEAAAAAIKRRPELQFVCVGGGPVDLTDTLTASARTLGIGEAVRWTGHVDDVRAAYSALDLGCSVSRGEGFSNAIGEAMACGVRMVVTDVGESAEIVGDTGLVVRVGDVDGLARAMVVGVAPGAGGRPEPRARIDASFSVTRMVDASEQLLLELRRASRLRTSTGRVSDHHRTGLDVADHDRPGADGCSGADSHTG
jgi:glycosyltransferase involved in cell wall biosynthesis